MSADGTRVSRTSSGRDHLNTLVPVGPCFVHVQVYDDELNKTIGGASYTLTGRKRGKVYSGATDDQGILIQRGIPDDHYDLEIDGKKEQVEVWYMIDFDVHEGKPWVLRMRETP